MTDFRDLHVPGNPLILVNAWDAASARIAAAAGAAAVGTTSAGVAWSLGAPDGDTLPRDEAIAAIRRIRAAVDVPVTADIESGFGATPAEVADTVRAVVAAGAAGINIEDGRRPIDEQRDRIAGARSADPGLFINARIDTYLKGTGGVAETIERATAFVAAGADGIFVPGVADPGEIATLVEAIAAPVNVMVWPGALSVPELAKLGVARVSLGSAVAQAAYAVVRRAVEEAAATGTYESVAGGLEFGELNALMGA
jgi:2-methylisocitrate lyase-like PEP mutase family enzyme